MQPDALGDLRANEPAYRALESLVVGITGHARLAARNGLLLDKVERRMRATGIPTLDSYLDFLSCGPEGTGEFDALIAELTIGETSFFRHPEQFDVLRDRALPELFARKAGSRQVRIWSAGCANGAEAYSISILVHALLGTAARDWDVTIVGSDISRVALDEAHRGIFSNWVLRELSDSRRRGFFTRCADGWAIREKYRQNVQFVQHNLISEEFPSIPKNIYAFDLVLCRNVMIYFDEQTNARLADRLASVMVDGAWLFVAPADFSPRLQRVYAAERADGGAFAYRKLPVARAVAGKRRDVAVTAPAPEPVQPPPRLKVVREAPADVAAIVAAANRGDWVRAAALADVLLQRDPCDAAARYYRALILINTGRAGDAERELSKTVYLDRDFALAHYQLGLARRDAHDLRAAARSFRNVIEALGDAADDRPVCLGDDLRAADLRALAAQQLTRLGRA